MFPLKFLGKVAAITTILLILLSNLQHALAVLANLVIVIPFPLQGF